MNTHTKPSRPAFLTNPFYTIAGWKALAWGLLGMAVATAGSMAAHLHYHGLMHYGSAPNDAWWCYTAEHLVVWLVPAAIFYVAGLLLSPSRIRLIDVLGTTAFAQIPFAVMNLFYLPEQVQTFIALTPEELAGKISQESYWLPIVGWLTPSLLFLAVVLCWLAVALKTSCNLRGWRLLLGYAAGIIGGDMACRLIISLMYK